MSKRHETVPRCLLMILSITATAACGGKSDDETKATSSPASAAAPAAGGAAAPPASSAPEEEDDRLATAVPTGKTGAAVDLRYDIAAKPAVGAPFEVALEFRPRLAADALEVQLSAMPGLTIAAGQSARFDGVQFGKEYTVKAIVSVDAPGLYYIGVVATTVTKIQTEARTFSVPIVVGAAPVAAEKPEPARDASGQPIESMPATEKGNN
jgi:hypothetical protein